MPGLLSALEVSGRTLAAFDRALEVTQNNVANIQTPGYAKQTQILESQPFDPSAGVLGGVLAGEVVSARNDYAEQAVRTQTVLLGQAQQNVGSLTSLQSLFDISGNSGRPYSTVRL
jgi:flagellar hook-associated protein 1 FlgK